MSEYLSLHDALPILGRIARRGQSISGPSFGGRSSSGAWSVVGPAPLGGAPISPPPLGGAPISPAPVGWSPIGSAPVGPVGPSPIRSAPGRLPAVGPIPPHAGPVSPPPSPIRERVSARDTQ